MLFAPYRDPKRVGYFEERDPVESATTSYRKSAKRLAKRLRLLETKAFRMPMRGGKNGVSCPHCGKTVRQEDQFSLDSWHWPEFLAHHIAEHKIEVPYEFVEFVIANTSEKELRTNESAYLREHNAGD